MQTAISIVLLATACAYSSPALADESITYRTHIRRIFRDSCVNCHNASRSRAGLDLSSYAGVLKGSSSGEVVVKGDPEDSFLYLTMTHAEEPAMPPGKARLNQKILSQMEGWIRAGLPEQPSDLIETTEKGWSQQPEDAAISNTTEDLSFGQQVYIGPNGTPVTALAVSPDESTIAVAGQLQVLLFEGRTGKFATALPYPEGDIFRLIFSRDGELLVASGGTAAESGNAVVWSVNSRKRLHLVGEEYDVVTGCDISPNGERVVFGGPDRVVKIADLKSQKIIGTIRKHTDWVLAASFSPEGLIFASADRAGNAYVFASESLELVHTLRGHSNSITDIAWTGDGSYCYTSSEDGSVRRWNMHTGETETQWVAHEGGVLSMKTGPNDQVLTTGRDGFVRLWDSTGSTRREIKSRDIPTRADFIGQSLVVGDWSGNVELWPPKKGANSTLRVPPSLQKREVSPFLAEVSGPTPITEVVELTDTSLAQNPTAQSVAHLEFSSEDDMRRRLQLAQATLDRINDQLRKANGSAEATDAVQFQAALVRAAQIAETIANPRTEVQEARIFLNAAVERLRLMSPGSHESRPLSTTEENRLRTQLKAADGELRAVVADCRKMKTEYDQIETKIADLADQSLTLKSEYIRVVGELEQLTKLSRELDVLLNNAAPKRVDESNPASAN